MRFLRRSTANDDGGRPAVSLTRVRVPLLAAAAFAAMVVASQLVELFINRVLRPDLEEWTWISEVLVIAALLVSTALYARLLTARTAIAELERETLTIRAELAVAAKVQRALLPLMPEPTDGMTWHAAMEPAGEVGGDYYDFFPVGDGRMCVVLADVSGKGVPAAVFVSNTRAVLRAVAREQRTSPAALLSSVSEILFLDGRSHLYVTCLVAMLDTQRHTFTYANAGHPPGLILSAGGNVRALNVGGPPLGLFPSARFDEVTSIKAATDDASRAVVTRPFSSVTWSAPAQPGPTPAPADPRRPVEPFAHRASAR